MATRLILISPEDRRIDETVLNGLKFQITDVKFKDENRAVQIISPQPRKDVREACQALRDQHDIFVLRDDAPQPKLLICDMDSTIIESETLDDLAAAFKLQDKIAAITERAMRGELDFKSALTERVSMLKDLPEQEIFDLLPKLKISKGADKLITKAKAKGVTCLLVSGGFKHVTSYVAKNLGFDDDFGNEFIIKGGVLTGDVKQPIQDKNAKLNILNEFVDDMDITNDEVMAIGDGANDIPMLQAAGYGIAYKGKSVVQDAVDLQINHTDLSAAAYLFDQSF